MVIIVGTPRLLTARVVGRLMTGYNGIRKGDEMGLREASTSDSTVKPLEFCRFCITLSHSNIMGLLCLDHHGTRVTECTTAALPWVIGDYPTATRPAAAAQVWTTGEPTHNVLRLGARFLPDLAISVANRPNRHYESRGVIRARKAYRTSEDLTIVSCPMSNALIAPGRKLHGSYEEHASLEEKEQKEK